MMSSMIQRGSRMPTVSIFTDHYSHVSGTNSDISISVHWCRFIVKQTFENLAPKRTFTPYVPHNGKSDGDASVYPDLHGPQTIQYGWEWHKMWFFARWESSGARTFVCFDLPPRTSEYIQAELVHRDIHGLSHQDSPYYTLAIVVEGVMRVYNESVWSIRNLISQREAVSRSSQVSRLLPELTMTEKSSRCRLRHPA
jgi:hypothetical protein